MTILRICNLSHPLRFQRGWVVKLLELLRQTGLEHPIAGVLVCRRRELDPLLVGGALDYWQPQELVGVVVEVVEVEVVEVVPPVEDREEARRRMRTTTTTPHVAMDSTQTLTTKHPSRFLDPRKIA